MCRGKVLNDLLEASFNVLQCIVVTFELFELYRCLELFELILNGLKFIMFIRQISMVTACKSESTNGLRLKLKR